MRYFRRTYLPPPTIDGNFGPYEPGIIKSETFFDMSLNKLPNEYWEEVIVIPKPQPKKHIKKIAYFCWDSSDQLGFDRGFTLDEEEAQSRKNSPAGRLIRVTDWVEVTFTEKVS